ncbi:MAG: lysine--tRNA ligase [Patescibacteria group bacterium]
MTIIQSEKQDRLIKLDNLKKQNINSYPSKCLPHISIGYFLDRFNEFESNLATVSGRIMSQRTHGKLTFMNLKDESHELQIAFQQDKLGSEKYKNLKNIDIGDILEVSGMAFITHKGEKSLLVASYSILSKALQPLPDKWHGIKDEETRYRKRYLDILLDSELQNIFRKKAVFWQSIRDFLIGHNFLEVETPVLEATPGGADAEPFITHHNALDIDLYLRISMGELWQKRLMVSGLERTFEIGRQFRNEGIDAEHLQDYTQMEFYMAYANYDDGMKLVEDMFKKVIFKTFQTLKFDIKNFHIDLSKEWGRIDYVTSIKEKFSIDVLTASIEELQTKCKELKIDVNNKVGKGRLIDSLWKQVRKEIAGPVFLINHPVEVSPLAKRKSDDQRLVERFQVIIAGSELGNGYSELNDPIDQAARFNEQAKLREAGDSEAQMHDSEFVEALEYGMPPTCGFGLSERVFAFLMNKPVRECVLFPLLRPKNNINLHVKKLSPGNNFSISREQSFKLLTSHVHKQPNIFHSLEAEAVLGALAKALNQNEALWSATGLLHDIDWEEIENKIEKHAVIGSQYLKEANYPQELINAILAHNYQDNKALEPEVLLDFALRCGEAVTGLIYASALVRPDKQIQNIELKSLKKKLKEKAFAAKVNRETIKECKKLGLSTDEFLEIALNAMKQIADQIGF